ncbi:nuclear transport factor 2 family protein [Phyllobacterium sp. SB3]|uniref:nuclear transport factor 2 family protein n=1 Tax=Phyllobacterium sp. SB3 TaxID=3156073 RepID=UPI0032AEDFF3
MSTSRELLIAFFDCLGDLDNSIDRCVDLFAEDGVFEFPYFSVLGMPTRFQGKTELRQVLGIINAHFSAFTLSEIEVHEVKEGDALFVRYHSDGFIDRSERVYAQDYVSQLIAVDGKIKVLREYLNVINTARMLFPNGLADVPAAAG